MRYYKLIDPQHAGTVVRTDGPSQQQHVPRKGWTESGIMAQYMNDESDLYDQYVEISEEEATRLVDRKGV